MADSAAIRAGRAFVELFTDDIQLEKGLRKAAAKVQAFGRAVVGIGAGFGALGAAITGPLLAASKTFADAGSALVNMSARTGVSVEALSALGFAAGQAGSDIESVEIAIKRMQKSLVAGSEENMAAEATFLSLGLSVESLMNLKPEQQFQAIARAIAAIPSPTAKAGAALQIFGKSGTSIIPLIDNLDALTSEAKQFGVVTSTQTAESAHRLEQSMNLLEKVTGSLTKAFGSALAPMLTDLYGTMARVTASARDWVKANGPLVLQAFKIGSALAAIGAAFAVAGGAFITLGAVLGGVATTFGAIGTVIGALLSPIGLVVAGLVGLGAWFLATTDTGGKALAWLGERFGELESMAVTAFKGIGDALKAGDIMLAGQILWAGLKAEFLRGVTFLMSLWADWGTAVRQVFADASTAIASVWINTWFGIQREFLQQTGAIQDTWTQVTGDLWSVWGLVVDKIKDYFGAAISAMQIMIVDFVHGAKKGLAILGGPIGLTRRLEELQTEADKAKAEIQGAQDAAVSGRAAERDTHKDDTERAVLTQQQERANKVAGLEQSRTDEQAALASGADIATEDRRKKAQEGVAPWADALKQAQDELAALTDKAGKEAAAVKPIGGGKLPGFTPEGLDQTIQQTKAKVDTAGTFSASAVSGLGAGQSVADEQLKEQKKHTEELQKLNRKAATGRLIFS